MTVMKAELTVDLQHEYESRFAAIALQPAFKDDVEDVITRMLRHRDAYVDVSNVTGVPWYLIALIHQRECDGNFGCHLHNGNPLSARTVDEPAGRPKVGRPPFTWRTSAIDAMQFRGFSAWKNWSIAGVLFKLELYNGWGYRQYHSQVPTPYLWSGSQFYTIGKYASDGHFDPKLKDKEAGAAVILRRMVDQGVLHLDACGVDMNVNANAKPAAAATSGGGK